MRVMTMIKVPKPKYNIGDVVYYPSTKRESKYVECPDCGGTKEWEIKTAKSTYKIPCQRCVHLVSGVYATEFLPDVREITISGYSIDPAHRGDDLEVKYHTRSGSSYAEKKLYTSKQVAMDLAEDEAKKDERERRDREDNEYKDRLWSMDIRDAQVEAALKKKNDAEDKYHKVLDTIEGLRDETVDGVPFSSRDSSGRTYYDSYILRSVARHLFNELNEDVPDSLRNEGDYD